ncbi:sugar MFS transporter [Flavobacterium hercynium]|uniref:MFS transporter n=1 Tax=Flavobacterium hercynium TaxID=387094 RepID=A0A226H706_9FLAO|nr:sugar MFS transporter [Flavobacterium hercynium]OXA89982.1 MFS transporter [Flavobacterium hercynium]
MNTKNTTNAAAPNYTVPLVTITLLFFMWGFITCMNDILIPYLKKLFALTFVESMLVQFCFFGAYFLGSLLYFTISYYKGDPINKVGYKKGMLAGILLSAVGCVLFYPAATFSVYGLFLGALFVLGLGFTILQITANAYVSLLGSEESASGRLNMTQGFNAFGTTIAPILGGYLIFGSGGEHIITAEATRIPYLVFAGILILVALLIYNVKLPSFQSEETEQGGLGALKFPHLRLGIFAIFFYVGGEVAVGSFIISFLELDTVAGLTEAMSKNYLAMYWGGSMIGRFLGAISLNQGLSDTKKTLYMILTAAAVFLVIYGVVDLTFGQMSFFLVFLVLNFIAFIIGKSKPARTLAIFASINAVLLIFTILSTGKIAMYGVLGVGIFNSIMFSNIFTLSISGLGKYTSQGSSLLVMAILGGALVPLIQGFIADSEFGVQKSFVVPVFCYLYVLFFGIYCSKKLHFVEHSKNVSGH